MHHKSGFCFYLGVEGFGVFEIGEKIFHVAHGFLRVSTGSRRGDKLGVHPSCLLGVVDLVVRRVLTRMRNREILSGQSRGKAFAFMAFKLRNSGKESVEGFGQSMSTDLGREVQEVTNAQGGIKRHLECMW